jgi:hypothetical protein
MFFIRDDSGRETAWLKPFLGVGISRYGNVPDYVVS